ncbi:baseplate J/gp47 family protein [Rhizobium sp. FKY42]|uniref:baseplate J/gp47 family protein n=1 Tax=Rhizobium sp. FKY42 TaxID=2562310 RepID=UPI001FED9643|nr:baseplate J/gp47 family protein [Rhizobium sp. FKY42]
MIYAPTAIDLSRIPLPAAIEPLDFDVMFAGAVERFVADYAASRAIDPSLKEYTVENIKTDPVITELRTWSNLRLYDRQRVNDGIMALLAVRATGADLDNVVASRNIERLVAQPATANAAEVMEGDAALLRRYLLSYDAPAAGSAGRYLFDAWSAWPQSADKTLGLWDARVNGFDVHGRRGDTDVVIIGPSGRLPTSGELTAVRNAVRAVNRSPEGVAVSVLAATRVEYAVSLVIEVPGAGPAPSVLVAEAETRVRAAALQRTLIGGEIPGGLLAGSAYGANIIKVRDLSPVAIPPDPYKVPAMTALTITPEVRS